MEGVIARHSELLFLAAPAFNLIVYVLICIAWRKRVLFFWSVTVSLPLTLVLCGVLFNWIDAQCDALAQIDYDTYLKRCVQGAPQMGPVMLAGFSLLYHIALFFLLLFLMERQHGSMNGAMSKKRVR